MYPVLYSDNSNRAAKCWHCKIGGLWDSTSFVKISKNREMETIINLPNNYVA